jgi:hypothetical protein
VEGQYPDEAEYRWKGERSFCDPFPRRDIFCFDEIVLSKSLGDIL